MRLMMTAAVALMVSGSVTLAGQDGKRSTPPTDPYAEGQDGENAVVTDPRFEGQGGKRAMPVNPRVAGQEGKRHTPESDSHDEGQGGLNTQRRSIRVSPAPKTSGSTDAPK